MSFVIVSKTIDVFFFVEKELSHRCLWKANNAISLERNIFSEVDTTLKAYKKLYATSLWTYKPGIQLLVQ